MDNCKNSCREFGTHVTLLHVESKTFCLLRDHKNLAISSSSPSLLILTIRMYRKLQCLKADEEFADYADVALRKCILKVRLSLLISSIFIISQILVWLPLPYDVRYTYIEFFFFVTVQFIFRS